MITLDTSGLYALLNRSEPEHQGCRAVARADGGPLVVPAGTLGEVAYMVERRLARSVLEDFLLDLEEGRFLVDCGEDDLPRIRHLVRRYADLPLGYVDAAVIACAERRGGRVLTLDRRHFGVVAREGRITPLPT